MDLHFQTQNGGSFTIEVGFFDTVLEIKEKIEKYEGIPISRQTLIFNGHVLQDDRDIERSELLHNSNVNLVVAPDPDKPQIKSEQSSPPRKINLKINVQSSPSKLPVALEMDVNDTVLRLKEKIQEMESVHVSRLMIQSNGVELRDHHSLGECDLVNNSEVNVNIRPSGSATAGSASKKLKVMVLPKSGTKKIPVEVNAADNVAELRKELQKLQQEKVHINLPQEGYFFIYKQNVMDDDRSFRWHHVGQGDTIEIFNGSVTGGS